MTTADNTFEGGTNGATITTANSGGTSGAAFDNVAISSGGTLTYSTTAAMRGSLGASATIGATAGTVVFEYTTTMNVNSTGQVFARLGLRMPSFPASDSRIAVVTDSAFGFNAEWRINSTGKLELRSGAGSLLATSTRAIAANTPFAVEIGVLSFSATTGQITARLFLDPTSATPDETLTSTATQDTLGAGGVCHLRAGILRPISNFTTHFDDVRWSTVGFPGPFSSTATKTTADSATLTESSSIKVVIHKTATDQGTFSQTSAVQGIGTPKTASDSGLFAETVSVVTAVDPAADGVLTETSSITARLHASDSGLFTDSSQLVEQPVTITVFITSSDSGAFTETSSPLTKSILVFRGPTREEVWPVGPGERLAVQVEVNQTVYRKNGTWRVAENLSATDLEGADRVYFGGYEIPLSSEQADELTAAGFGEFIFTVQGE